MGGHAIGLTRSVFGGGLQGHWVNTGRDQATSGGPVFDNTYHSFLVNDISTTTVEGFDLDRAPSDEDFPDWFRDTSADVNYLDTDVVLAFPSLNTAIHPYIPTSIRSHRRLQETTVCLRVTLCVLWIRCRNWVYQLRLSSDLDCIP